MHLLSVNLQRGSSVSCAIYGNFSTSKAQEIVVARGTGIELFRPDETGQMVSIDYTPCFAVVRSLQVFRLMGSNVDYLVIGSDSGKLTIVEYNNSTVASAASSSVAVSASVSSASAGSSGAWKILHSETFGKTGCRRIVPGQYLAADPKGRAILVAGVEKQRFVYVMNRDGNNKLTISSPLEAHKAETILFSCVGLDVGLENPIFALLELEYAEADADSSGQAAQDVEKKLTYYELDLGLNHVVRKWSESVSRTANLLLPVPSGDDGPGGVLICGENWVSYKHQGHREVRTPLPRRHDMPSSRGLLVVSGTVHKQKGMFFFLLQSELGDLYKATLSVDSGTVIDLQITVFDSITPAVSLCITKRGLLFAASEHSTQYLFEFQGMGESATAVRAGCVDDESLGDDALSASSVAQVFRASDRLANLRICDAVGSLSPVTDMCVAHVGTGAGGDSSKKPGGYLAVAKEQNIHLLCGVGHRSAFRTLRHGCNVSELAASVLPGKPTGVWTVCNSVEDVYDSHIIVSFATNTIVLSVGETVEEVTDSGFLLDVPTLAVVMLSDSSRVQVHPKGVRHVRHGGISVVEWKAPGGRKVEKACANSRQVILALQSSGSKGVTADNEVLVFELDEVGQLAELGSASTTSPVCSLDIAPVPEGRLRFPFLAVGCLDDTVQLLSLEPTGDALLSQRALMAVDSRPDSLCFVHLGQGGNSAAIKLHLNIGLQTGVLHRLTVDGLSGSLSDSRQRFLGGRAITLQRIHMDSVGCGEGLLALSSRPWTVYIHQGRFFHSPLCYENIDVATSFRSEGCQDGIVATVGNSLRIISVDDVGSMFSQSSVLLPFTPKKMACTDSGAVVIVASDQHAFTASERLKLHDIDTFVTSASAAADVGTVKIKSEDGEADDGEEEEDDEGTFMALQGPLPPLEGKWASCIAVVDPSTGKKYEVPQEQNEAAFCVCVAKLDNPENPGGNFVIVGTAVGLHLHPRSAQQFYLVVYRFDAESLLLTEMHKTAVDEMPMCLSAFGGRLLVGVGKSLRLYELGRKQLLRKSESRGFPSAVVRIETHGDRIFVGDMSESVFFAKYKKVENTFVIFAEDIIPRWTNTMCVLDHHTLCGSDKFGNVFVLRASEHADDDVDGATGARTQFEVGGRAQLVQECHFYLGDMVTSMKKAQFVSEGKEMVLASTLGGALYALLPLTSKGDLNFFTALETFLRKEVNTLCGRGHQSYRSYYQPVRNVVDGDFCEQYLSLPFGAQSVFAEEQGRTVTEVLKKLEDMREVL